MRKIAAIALMILIAVCALTACNGDEKDDVNHNVVTGAATPAEFTANTYLLDSWREEPEDGERAYYITLLMYSEDYYARPTKEDLKYKTDDGYKSIEEAIENVSVVIYHVNDELKGGICAYAKIKTSALIDTKKIYVLLEGPDKYQEGSLTKEEYQSVHGSLDGWRSLLTNVSSKTPPNEEAAALQTSFYNGVIRLYDEKKSQYYYSSNDPNPIIDGSTMLTKIFVDPMKEVTLESLAFELLENGGVVKIIDGNVESIELDARLKIACKVVDGELWLGFETVDGSDFSAYDGEVPNAITYAYNKTSYFVIR